MLPNLFELPAALLEYLDLLQGDCSPPAPQGCYAYIIIKMIEIYNIVVIIAGDSMHTTSKQSPHTSHFSIDHLKKTLRYQLCSTRYAAVRINNCLKRTFAIKVATTDDFCNKWKPSRAIDTFCGEQR